MEAWKIRITILLAALVPLILLAYFALEVHGEQRLRQARELFEREVGPLKMEIPSPVEVPREDDVVALLREGVRVAEQLAAEQEDPAVLKELVGARAPEEWSADDVARVKGLLERLDPLVDVYRQGGARSRAAYRPEDVTDDDFSLPAFQGSRLLLAEAGLALRRGDEVAAWESLEAMVRIAKALGEGPGLVQRLLARAIEERFLRGVRWVAEREDVSVEILRGLLEELPERDPAEAFRRSMAMEAGHMLRVFQGLDARGRSAGKPVRDWYAKLPGALALDMAEMLDSYRELAALAEYPYGEARTTRAESLEGPRRSSPKIVMELLIPNLYGSIAELQAMAASRQLARKALELRIAALEGEGYPDSLPDLEPDPFTGSRPEYVVTDTVARLENPLARELWQIHRGEVTKRPPPPYGWSLPQPDLP